MFLWVWIFGVVLLESSRVTFTFTDDDFSCEEFEKGARFDPYTAIDSMWKIFYFWGNNTETYPIIFSLPAKQRIERFKRVVDAVDPDMNVEWHRATLFMEPRPGFMVMFMYQGTPGAFRALIKKEQREKMRPHPMPLIAFADIRMKYVDRIIGMMCCEDLSAFALARVGEMPETEAQCKDAARLLGLNIDHGRSYLWLANYTRHRMDDEL